MLPEDYPLWGLKNFLLLSRLVGFENWHLVTFWSFLFYCHGMNILYLILFFYISGLIFVNFTLILFVYVAQWASQVELMAKSLLANAGDIVMWVCSLGQEDHWIPWTEFHGQRNMMGYSPWSHKVSHTTKTHTLLFLVGKYRIAESLTCK